MSAWENRRQESSGRRSARADWCQLFWPAPEWNGNRQINIAKHVKTAAENVRKTKDVDGSGNHKYTAAVVANKRKDRTGPCRITTKKNRPLGR
ncbi:MAG: hypothetical protein ACI875_001523 [Planctomycetota bacterium]|jgi:hypothetical protein